MQFRLSTLIAVTTVTAVFCAIFFAVPLVVEIPLLALIVLVAPSVWICGACFARGPWRAFFLGGICAGIIPQTILLTYGGMAGAELMSDGFGSLNYASADSTEYLLTRVMVAGAFLLPGFLSLLGGSCGALVYRWFAVEAVKPGPASRLTEPYLVLESRLTPLTHDGSQQSTQAAT